MIRPRAGDFVFGEAEIDLMLADIDDAHGGGACRRRARRQPAGRTGSTRACLGRLHDHAAALGLSTTLHRAFDLAPDLDAALESAIDLGFDRVLTSGGAPTARRRPRPARRAAQRRTRPHRADAGLRDPPGYDRHDRRAPAGHRDARLGIRTGAPPPRASAAFGFDSAAPRRTSERIVRDLQRAWHDGADAR